MVSDDPLRLSSSEKSIRGGRGSIKPPGRLSSSAPSRRRAPTLSSVARSVALARTSTLCIRHSDINATLPDPSSAGDSKLHVEIEYDEEECAITSERLQRARGTFCQRDGKSSDLTSSEIRNLQREQKTIRKTLFLPGAASTERDSVAPAKSIKEMMQLALVDEDEEEEEEEKVAEAAFKPQDPSGEGGNGNAIPRPYSSLVEESTEPKPSLPAKSRSERGLGTVKAQFITAKLRARADRENDGVLGVQGRPQIQRFNSIRTRAGNFMAYNMRMSGNRALKLEDVKIEVEEEDRGEAAKEMDVEDISYVRKPNLAKIIEEYEALQNHPKYSLKQVVLSRRFHLYAHRFGNAQYQRTLVYPTLRQPEELYTCPWLKNMTICGEVQSAPRVTEKQRTRNGHRFIIAADTQFGILMDGFSMDFPSWSQEIEISRKCVAQINAMTGSERPLFVCVCGDLVDTESSFSGAIASWKKVMSGWERNLVFEQQVRDFKRVWAQLHDDIALVCLCGNHDVGNRPTRASINHWTSSFGDEYLAFWVNGSYNICLNNCLFSNPSGAPDMFDEQLQWMEDQLSYARENDATHIFVYGHFPWFLKHEEEADDFLTSYSAAPAGWGPPGSSFADSYFTIPYETRKIAMELFRKYDVTACFSGHFHQNVVAQTSWGMPMIVTGPLSMNLNSEIAHELANGETNGIGMRVVDVGEKGEFKHKWILIDDEKELYESGIKRCLRQSMVENGQSTRGSLFDEVEVSPMEAYKWKSTRISLSEFDDEDD